MRLVYVIGLVSLIKLASAGCGSAWSQCGGKNFSGSDCCVSGYTCKYLNDWYSQCVPGNSDNSNKATTTKKATTKKTTTKKATTKKATTKKTKTEKITTKTQQQQQQQPTSSSGSESSVPDVNNNISGSSSSVIGYASLNGGTTGGKGGQTVTVSSQSELETTLNGTNSKIIKVNGIVKLNGDIIVNSNTSIIGSGKNSGFTGGGLKIKSASNIIIQNLKFSFCLGSNKDCINAQKSNNIWVDHCEFFSDRNHDKDYYDGLIDFSHASDYITISWNYVHDHYKTSLIGHSNNNGKEDTGKLHITYHHNYFKNAESRLPSLRFGTGHIFNNVYENIEVSSINIRMGAKALIEGNVFKNANKPISTNLNAKIEGSVIERNNDFGSTANTNSITKTDGLSSVPYQYSVDNVNNVYNSVVRNVGPQ